jgi:hypothetical protein
MAGDPVVQAVLKIRKMIRKTEKIVRAQQHAGS